jgi:acyl carrier protein
MATKYLMTKEAVLERVKQVIVSQLYVTEEMITPETVFFDDLEADSLDIVELILTFEEAFKIDISDEAAADIKSVQDVVDFVLLALEIKEKEGDKRKKLPGELAQELNLVEPLLDDEL